MAGDRFSSFADLKREKRPGLHYWICSRDRGSRVLVMAPHGGKIEPYTTDLAETIAGDDFSFYSFMGRQRRNNYRDLHVRSHLYDEERALEMVNDVELVFAIHGHRCKYAEFVMLGGSHTELAGQLGQELTRRDFPLEEPEQGLAGVNANNICNRGRLGKGVQVEISRALRDRLREQEDLRASFVEAARTVFLDFEAGNGT